VIAQDRDLEVAWWRSLAKLAAQALGPAVLQKPSVPTRRRSIPHPEDGRIYRELFERAVAQFDLPTPPAVITRAPLHGHAGQITRERSLWRIVIDSRRTYDSEELLSIMAHEVGHIVLRDKGISTGGADTDESLTDAVAVFGGFGDVMIGANHRVLWTPWFSSSSRLGYLSWDAIRWLTEARRKIGAKEVWQRSHAIDWSDSSIALCPVCGQQLRAPNVEALLVLTCPICGARQGLRIGPEPHVVRLGERAWRQLTTLLRRAWF
jgi:hypothetical protein